MSNDIDNNETLSITENVCAENDNFPSDMTEYYYRCRISNIELGAQKFYIIINTILENSNLLITNITQNGSSNTTSSVLQQLIKYNDDFHKISMRLIEKEDIDSIDVYRNQFKLLMCIVNEAVVLLSKYTASTDIKKINKIELYRTETNIYKEYDFQKIIDDKKTTTTHEKKIKFLELVNRLAEIPQVINPDDIDILVANTLMTPFTILFLVISLLFLALLVSVFLTSTFPIVLFIIDSINQYNNTTLIVTITVAIITLIVLLFRYLFKKLLELTMYSPNYDYIERRRKAYNQNKKYVVQTEIKSKIKSENIRWIVNNLFETIQSFGSK